MTSARNDNPDTFTLVNGIKLVLNDASPMLVVMLRKQLEGAEPQPPMITREDRGGRQDPNPDDPVYLAAKARWAMDVGTRTVNILAASCVTVDHIPDHIPGPDSDDWVTHATDVLGFDVPENATLRMVQWLLLQATADDLEDLSRRMLAHVGAPEVDVGEALASFPGYGERPADRDGTINGSSPDDDTVSTPDTRTRAERRRARGG